ncbi:uncharacterized protein M421DRAFT_8565 [Didymella exigua CBS 183.55]|uniref:Fungal calcium binding protein domain-containing protein n=1 Tax=Didymella exigua CBS 183.55 TaxID=1150837 RepID=A0A6A5RBP4_9PLEO|nr:uncharacterized protein M421DRAFT_8565 [Didymella exigua CBS 183.55]KAF1924700.1 hypothetical protein M421DRAFT_8565 [Didymella exigua CBS 183.55]
MKASIIFALATSLLAAANPVVFSRDAETPDTVIANYNAVADDTVSRLTVFGCHMKECVEALSPLLASCAIAAAEEGRNTAKDASCVGKAYQSLAPSKKPAECNHCYH